MLALENPGFNDFGLISIMYHRFDESKYPSTNIQMIFSLALEIIENEKIAFIHPKDFEKRSLKIKTKENFIYS